MTADPSAQADLLRADIAALRQAIAALAALPDMQRPLQEQLAAKERDLAAFESSNAPVVRSHTQHIGVAIAGDVHGVVTHVEQSGGVNVGTGNSINRIGDIVSGDKIQGDKVVGNKVINYSAPRPADTSPDHLQRLIALSTRRLRVLEEHTAATMLADAGASQAVIAAILGHALPGVTGNYTHVSFEAMREAVECAVQRVERLRNAG